MFKENQVQQATSVVKGCKVTTNKQKKELGENQKQCFPWYKKNGGLYFVLYGWKQSYR